MYKIIFVLLFYIFHTIGVSAQISGKIVSGSTDETVQYARIVASDDDGKFLDGTTSNKDGEFVLENLDKVKRISITHIGFEKKDTCSTTFFYGNIGTISLISKSQNLGEVTIIANMIKQDATKETIYITDSLRHGTVNAIQLLSKITGITTDRGTDEIKIGKDRDVPIIVNGNEVKKDYAININPERIRKVEILRHPAGKYSDYPIIINLILTNNYIGWDVSAFTKEMFSLRNKHSNSETIGTNFSYSLSKINFYGNLSITHKQIYNASNFDYSGSKGQSIHTDKIDVKSPNISFLNKGGEIFVGADYKFSNKHTLSFQSWQEQKNVNNAEIYNVWQNNIGHTQLMKDDYSTKNYTIGFFYNGKFVDKLNVTNELLYNRYDLNEECNFINHNSSTLNLYHGNKNYWRYYVSADYLLSDKLSLTADYSQIWTDYTNSNKQNGNLLYRNKETRNKIMVTISYKPLDNLNFKLGSHILNVKDKDKLTNDAGSHTSWMPLFKGYWKPAKWIDLLVNYYCDVEHPNLDQLSIVEWQVNNVLWKKGNSALEPRIMHYSDFSITLCNIIKFNYMFKKSNNEIIDYYLDDGNKTYKTKSNCNFDHNYIGIEGDYGFIDNYRFSFVANYQWYSRYIDNTKHHGKTWYIDTNVQYNIPNTRWSVMTEYFLRHDKFPLLQGIQYNEEEDLILSVAYPVYKNRIPIALSLKLPSQLIPKRTYTEVGIPNFHYRTEGDNRVNSFCLMLNIKYNINKGKPSKISNYSNVDKEK